MKNLNMKTAIKRYNNIMSIIGYEHNTIGTKFSECTDNWNLRDMVAECDYTLSGYFKEGHCNQEMRYENTECKEMWKSETGKLKRFIESYKLFIEELECVSKHCSRFDNKRRK